MKLAGRDDGFGFSKFFRVANIFFRFVTRDAFFLQLRKSSNDFILLRLLALNPGL